MKQTLVAVIDSVSCAVAAWLAFSLRLGDMVPYNRPLVVFTLAAMASFLAIFFVRGIYRNIFRFHGPHGLQQIARSCILLAVVLIVAFGLIGMPGVPRTVSVLFPLLFFIFVAVSRLVARFLLVELPDSGAPLQRVLIYGAGVAGQKLAQSLRQERGYLLAAYADDDMAVAGKKIEGVPILSRDEAEELLVDGEIDLVLLALPALARSERGKIVERLQGYKVHVQVLPSIREIVAGDVSISDLREVEITDLLARDPIIPDQQLMARAIEGKNVLVTGAGGSIGSELSRQILRQRPRCLVLLDMSEIALFTINNELGQLLSALNIDCRVVAELGTLENQRFVHRLFERYSFDTVYHVAAYKHVPLIEQNVVAGARNNILSTVHCATAAMAARVERFILVSTDKAVRPTNVMGATKRVCELVLQALDSQPSRHGTKFTMVRFGNVLGSSGSVVPHFRRQIASGGPVTITHRDVTRFFMTIPEAAELVVQAGAMAKGGEVYLLDMGEPIRIMDLARAMIEMSGRTVRDAANPDGDISIKEIGLRPGEKLHEELLIGGEALPTDHPRIFRAQEEGITWAVLADALDAMRQAIGRDDVPALKAVLAELVAGYGLHVGPMASLTAPEAASVAPAQLGGGRP